MTEFDAGVIVGLIIGEGSFTGDLRKPALQVKLAATDPDPITFLQGALGGSVYEYKHGGRHYKLWLLRGEQLKAAVGFFERRLPSCRKRTQFIAWRKKYGL